MFFEWWMFASPCLLKFSIIQLKIVYFDADCHFAQNLLMHYPVVRWEVSEIFAGYASELPSRIVWDDARRLDLRQDRWGMFWDQGFSDDVSFLKIETDYEMVLSSKATCRAFQFMESATSRVAS